MTTGSVVVRVVIGTIGAIMILCGLGLILLVGPVGTFGGGTLIVIGAVLVGAMLIEVNRYRSQAAERSNLSPGPGGGEPGPLEPRFQRTDEVFVDPTSNLTMRVFVDSRTGERRYVAEG